MGYGTSHENHYCSACRGYGCSCPDSPRSHEFKRASSPAIVLPPVNQRTILQRIEAHLVETCGEVLAVKLGFSVREGEVQRSFVAMFRNHNDRREFSVVTGSILLDPTHTGDVLLYEGRRFNFPLLHDSYRCALDDFDLRRV